MSAAQRVVLMVMMTVFALKCLEVRLGCKPWVYVTPTRLQILKSTSSHMDAVPGNFHRHE